MAVGTAGQILKVVLIVILIILLVIEFFTLFVGLSFVILPNIRKTLVHYGLYLSVASAFLIALAFVGLCGAVRECYLKLFVFAGLLIAFLCVALLIHLYMLPEDYMGRNAEENPPAEDTSEEPEDDVQRSVSYLSLNLSEYNRSAISKSFWDQTHRKWSCCGPNGPQSWLEQNLSIPLSCCHGDLIRNNIEVNDTLARWYCPNDSLVYNLYNRGCGSIRTRIAFQAEDESEDDSESEDENANRQFPITIRPPPDDKITMIIIIRTSSYFLQITAAVLAIWLGILILLSYNDCYYCY